MKRSSHSIERCGAFGWDDNGASHGWCQMFDFWNSFTRKNSVFEFRDSGVVAVDAMEGNTFLDFVNWAGVFGALRDSFHRNADFIVFVDQFVFQNDFFTVGQMFRFSFVFFRLFIGPFGFFPGVEFGFERGVFRIEFGFEWFVFRFVLVVFGFVFVEFGFEWFVFGFHVVHHCPFWLVLASIFLAGVFISPPLTFVGAGVEFIVEFFVFWIFSVFILTVEFIEVFSVGEVTSMEFGIGLTAQTTHHVSANLR